MKCAGCPTELPPNRVPGRQRKWCSEACRKRTCYSGTCIDCGGPTTVSAERCRGCSNKSQHEAAVWTRDRLIAEARRWHELVGRWPTAGDWFSSHGTGPYASAVHRELAIEFKRRTGPWPGRISVSRVFGSWAGLMDAVGGPIVGTRAGIRGGQRAAELRAALERLDA